MPGNELERGSRNRKKGLSLVGDPTVLCRTRPHSSCPAGQQRDCKGSFHLRFRSRSRCIRLFAIRALCVAGGKHFGHDDGGEHQREAHYDAQRQRLRAERHAEGHAEHGLERQQ